MLNRRKLIQYSMGAALFGLSDKAFAEDPAEIANLSEASPRMFEPDVRRVKVYNLHTGESLDAVYKERGAVIPDALAEVNKVLRDFRNDQICKIDVRLLDLLDDMSKKLETDCAFNVVSAYRSPQTNAMLAERSNGVAKGSLHMQGKAIDIRVPGVGLKYLRNLAKEMHTGGVGYYASSNFVHIDTGKVRYW